MFAGAAREAVFSNAEVIRRVNADFVPVALKAALVNDPPSGEEGQLYREIGRSKPAPQGICVVNSAGKVLNWTLMFDEDASVLAFFDRAQERFAEFPDAERPVAAEVYGRFPSQRRPDVEDTETVLPVLDRHPEGTHCPAAPPLRRGTVVALLYGRALDDDGNPLADTLRQEHYIEDRFNVAVETQEKLAQVLANAEADRVALPPEVARQWVKQAYMGVLDVQPLDNPGGNDGELRKCEFWAEEVGNGDGPTLWRVEGESEVFIDRMANGVPGDMHEVKLTWHGYIEMDGNRTTRLLLSAAGTERLKFGSARGEHENEVAFLPGGRRIDMACEVRFGIFGEPAGAGQVATDAPDAPQAEIPEDVRQFSQALGPPFLVFRDNVREELELSDEQAENLQQWLQGTVPDARQFFQKLSETEPAERERELSSYRQQAQEKLATFLKENLRNDQLRRLRQLELQQQGPFALGRPDVAQELNLTDEQRQQFVDVVRELQTRIAPLIEEAQSGGKPDEIRPRIMRIRAEHEGRIDAILNDAQRKQWMEMLGQPLNLED